jgi:hypothetical protein
MVGSMVNITTPSEGTEQQYVNIYARNLGILNLQYSFGSSGVAGVLLLPRTRAQGVADTLGWSKEKLKNFLWENSKIPYSWIESSFPEWRLKRDIEAAKPFSPLIKGQPWPITGSPENILVVVAGGLQGGHAYYLMGCFIEPPMTKEIKLPKNWGALLKQAEKDLGPLPAPM